jgi:hypothetical protein
MPKTGQVTSSCERSDAKTQQPPPTPKGREKAASASGSGVSAAPFPGAGSVPSGPLTKEKQKACQIQNRRKAAPKRLRQALNGIDMPKRWAAAKACGCFLQLI